MNIKSLGLVAAFVVMGSSAIAEPKDIGIKFDFTVEVSQQNAVTNNFLDPSKIYFRVSSAKHPVQDVSISALVYVNDSNNSPVARFSCHVGDLGKQGTQIYPGSSCDMTPSAPYVPSGGNLQAQAWVTFTDESNAVPLSVTPLPVPK